MLEAQGTATVATTATLTISGTVTVDSSASVTVQGTLGVENAGDLENQGTVNIDNGGTLSNNGNLDDLGTLVTYGTITNASALTVQTNAELEAFGDLTVAGGAAVDDFGTLIVALPGLLDIFGTVTVEPGSGYSPLGTVIIESGGALDILSVSAPSFGDLSAPSITYGTPSTTISGYLDSNVSGVKVPAGEIVQVTLAGVTQDATLDDNDDFTTTFATGALGVSSSPYTISFSYGGDAAFTSASSASTLTVNPATPVFTDLSAPTIIAGTPSTNITGSLAANAGSQLVPADETVQISVGGVTQDATLGADDSFSATFSTGSLPVSGSPYGIEFAYAGDSNFTNATGGSTLIAVPNVITLSAGSSLSSAIEQADSNVYLSNIIDLGSGTYSAAGSSGGISIPSANPDKKLAIVGAGPDATIITGESQNRVFSVDGNVTFKGLTIKDGMVDASGDNGTTEMGGGVYITSGQVTMSSVAVTGNRVLGGVGNPIRGNGGNALGGGVYMAAGTLSLNDCKISTNLATGGVGGAGDGGNAEGGGIYLAKGELSIQDTSINNNRASGGVGGSSLLGHSGGNAEGGGAYLENPSATLNWFSITLRSDVAQGGSGGGGPHDFVYYASGGNGGSAMAGALSGQRVDEPRIGRHAD